jgi:hypothetical protein
LSLHSTSKKNINLKYLLLAASSEAARKRTKTC